MNSKLLITLVLFVSLPIFITFAFAAPSYAAELNVDGNSFNNIQDSINNANTNDIIKLENKTYSGSGKYLNITNKNNLVIQGPSASSYATLDGRNIGRIVYIGENSKVTFKYINFINGNSSTFSGGAINTRSPINVENCYFSNNKGESGGAVILYSGSERSNFTNSIFNNNGGLYGGSDEWIEGGAIDIHAQNISIKNCAFTSNTAVNVGGALNIAQNILGCSITDSNFTSNSAPNGGALRISAVVTIQGCNFNANKATSGAGGSIYSSAGLTVINSKFSSSSGVNGGAIYSSATSSISGSSFSGNSATKNGGTIYSTGSLTISESTFSSNKAGSYGGAIASAGSSTISGSTFSGNSANQGSAIYSNNNLKIANSSFSNNKAVSSLTMTIPEGIKHEDKTIIKVTLYGNDNILNAIWQTANGNTYVNNVKQTPNRLLSKKSIVINGKYSGTTNSKGVASINYKGIFSTGVNSATYTFSAKFNGDTLYTASSNSLTAKATIASAKKLNWNLKTLKTSKTLNYIYKVNKKGWYLGSSYDSAKKNWKVWKKIAKPASSGTWYKLTLNSKKVWVKTPISAFKGAKSSSEIKLKRSVTSKSYTLTPHIKHSVNILTTIASQKITKKQEFFKKANNNIYLIGDSYSSSLSKYLTQKDSRCQVGTTKIKDLVKNIIGKVEGQLTAHKKSVAIFNWVRDNIGYQYYGNSHQTSHRTLNRRMGNCADQSILLVAMLRTAGIPAYYENWHQCRFGSMTSGHVWVQVYVTNTALYKADPISPKNSLGVINNWVGGYRGWKSASCSPCYSCLCK